VDIPHGRPCAHRLVHRLHVNPRGLDIRNSTWLCCHQHVVCLWFFFFKKTGSLPTFMRSPI
jgi:hypothetical protein